MIQAPYESNNNILFTFVKLALRGNTIYDRSSHAYPFTDKKLYKFQITGNNQIIKVKCRGTNNKGEVTLLDYLTFDGTTGNGIHTFFFPAILGRNEIVVTDSSNKLLIRFAFNCYNLHVFLAYLAFKFKQLRNSLQQALANTYYSDTIVKDLDGNYISAEQAYTKSVSLLLGSTRYSKFTNLQYYTFLHKLFDINKFAAGFEEAFRLLSQAFPGYISNIELIPVRSYTPGSFHPMQKVMTDGTNTSRLKIYPSYVFLANQWQMVPYYNNQPDPSAGVVFKIYSDGENESSSISPDQDKLKIKFTNSMSFYTQEEQIIEVFDSGNIAIDSIGQYTGFVNERYVVLGNNLVGGDIVDISSDGTVKLSSNGYKSARYIPKYNIVALGSFYDSALGNISITYNTRRVPLIYARTARAGTTGNFTEILDSSHIDTGHGRIPSYYDIFTYVILISSLGIIDNELLQILNNITRNVLPINCSYYLKVNNANGLFTFWSQVDISLQDVETAGLSFQDLL